MELVISNAIDFLGEHKDYLLKRESVSQLILFNAMAKAKEENQDSYLFGKIVNGDDALIVFCNILPYKLLIYSEEKEVKEDAMELLARYILEHNIEINGVNSNSIYTTAFIEQYRKLTNVEFKQILAMDIMELRELSSVDLTKGHSRLANAKDRDLMAQWESEFAFEALGEVIDPNRILEKVERQIEHQVFYLFENEENEIVSMAAPARKLIHGTCINYVYTPKKYRGRNYAMTNMYHLCNQLLKDGNQFVTLFVDKTNPISNRVYKKIGFQIIEDCYDYSIIK
ncbi:GNAT family N-acetyltransferase [Anaeromicropila herbilytica]|uniref:N-acetyltransferase domain-containing protein n=1 Tax=Anaeromicropila herbilytica TaxID=2785025 RepID=A0A7R7EKQ9_9FIRM|nr:GNAT family N-acetyltransferase [Anaeromicropila herbilytica]BCN30671.1 hypothetical protein bsdtb5_19660 [Anaeromicropila herbilytica]